MSRAILSLNALAIGLIGLLYLYNPNILLSRYGLESGSVGMDNMLRATYGGLYLLSATVFSMGVIVAARRRDALIFLAIFMAGAALGRIVSIIMAGMPPAAIMPLLYYELIMLAIAVVLARRASTTD